MALCEQGRDNLKQNSISSYSTSSATNQSLEDFNLVDGELNESEKVVQLINLKNINLNGCFLVNFVCENSIAKLIKIHSNHLILFVFNQHTALKLFNYLMTSPLFLSCDVSLATTSYLNWLCQNDYIDPKVSNLLRSGLVIWNIPLTQFENLKETLFQLGELSTIDQCYQEDGKMAILCEFSDLRILAKAKEFIQIKFPKVETCCCNLEQVIFDWKLALREAALANISTQDAKSSFSDAFSKLNISNPTSQIGWKLSDTIKVIERQDSRTTFMIKNIPNKYNQKMLIDLLNEKLYGKFDFLYLRIDFKNLCNVGYAFINFTSLESIIDFIRCFVGKKWPNFNSEKLCDLAYAKVQGKFALIEKFKNSSIMEKDPEFRPCLFKMGKPEPFPAATHFRLSMGSLLDIHP